MSSFKDIAEIFGNIANAPRIDELKAFVYGLQNENLEIKAKLEDLESELRVNKEWEESKALYHKNKTPGGAVVYVFAKEIIADVFYCPTCIEKHKTPIPLQPLDAEARSNPRFRYHWQLSMRSCPSCKAVYDIGDAHFDPEAT